MFGYMLDFFKSSAGVISHVSQWLTTPLGNVVFPNSGYSKDCPPAKSISVFFIHGTADRACGGKYLAKGILSDAPDCVKEVQLLAFDQRLSGKGVIDFAEQLIQRLVNSGAEQVVLIGHSRGGLIAAYAAQEMARRKAKPEVLATVCICAPFQGSYLARKPLTFISRSVEDMHEGNAFLTSLCDDIVKNPGCRYQFITGTQDYIVPKEGIIPDYVTAHPEAAARINGHSHLSIMGSARCHATIRQLLAELVVAEESKLIHEF